MAYYDIRQEGHKEAWDTTPGATPEDWDKALQSARDRARTQSRNYVVRHVSRQGARLIVTATTEGELAWPRLATPVLPLPEPELEDRTVEELGWQAERDTVAQNLAAMFGPPDPEMEVRPE